MDANSPWYELYKLLPTPFPYCGESNNNWIHDSMDTWTSLFYTAVSFWMYYKSKNYRKSPLGQLYLVPLLITFGSILFHISFTYIFLMADYFGIFTLTFYCLNLNRLRLSEVKIHIMRQSIIFSSIWVLSMLITYSFKLSSGLTMIPPIMATLMLEYKNHRLKKEISYKSFWLAGLLIIIGYIFMLLEGKPWHIGCFELKLHLHTIWHILSSLAMIHIFKFYSQFTLLVTEKNKKRVKEISRND